MLTSIAFLAATIQDYFAERDDPDSAAARAVLQASPEQIVATLRAPADAFRLN